MTRSKSKYTSLLLILIALFWGVNPLQAQQPQDIVNNPNIHVMPLPGHATPQPQASARQLASVPDFPQGHGMSYYGGPVMLGTVNVYYIWYGNFAGDSTVPILTDFMNAIGGSPYLNTTRSYYDGQINRIANSVQLAGTYFDNYSQGGNAPMMQSVVQNAIASGALGPPDPNGVYFVLTSPDVSRVIPGFNAQFCGWHSYFPLAASATMIKMAFVGDGGSQSACTVQPSSSPNDNPAADAMADVIAHELAEAVTDPQINAWFASGVQEIGDKCNWNMGAEQTAPNGSQYNVTLGSRNFLIQQLWTNDSDGYCTMQWPAPIPSGQWFNLVSKASGLCADVPTWPGDGNGQQPGTQLQEWYCWDGPMQKFMFTPVPGGYEITVQNSGQQWDVAGGPAAIYDGTPVIQWPYWGGSNEIWEVSDPDADGYVTISALNSARTLDAVSTPQTNYAQIAGTPLQQWVYWGGANQKWRLVPAQ